jgi:protoporphyrinogen oxidase
MEYGRKYHTAPADAMSTDWVGPRLYKPSIEEVIRGALTAATTDVHYVTTARYPTRDGFVSYLKGFVPHTNLRLGHDVVSIDHVARVLQFADGSSHGYDRLVSSFPLPELVRRMASAPREVVDAASRLACTTCVVVNIGVNRDDISENHWSYFYDQDYVFTRVSFPHMFSRHNVPANAGSIQAELYFSAKYRPLAEPPEAFIQPVIQDLIRCGLLREQDDVLYTGASVVPYANVIFDLERSEAVATVHGYLDELGIAYCGRYGEWGYHWTDEAFMSGERAARTILEEGGKPRS